MSDMKCPFCQQEMKRTNGTHNKVGVWQCQNSNDPDNVCIASGYLLNDDMLNYIARTRNELDIAMDGLKRIKKLTEPSYKNRNLEALALAVNTFSGEIIEQINQRW